jgi:hypothetical protein
LPVSGAVAAATAGVPVATGTVTDANGYTAVGAVVDLYAWPSDQVLQSLRRGQVVPWRLIATATVSSAGAFSLRISRATLSSAAVSGSYANLEAESGTASWSFTLNVNHPVLVHSISLKGAAPSDLKGAARRTCIYRYIRQIRPSWAIVGQSYVVRAATHVRQSFTYTNGQSSTLGVGLSPTGSFGSFTVGGTKSTSSSFTQSFPSFGRGFIGYRTRFRVAKYGKLCQRHNGYVQIKVASNGYAGGDSIVHPSEPGGTNRCEPEMNGSQVQTANEEAVTWSAGFSISQVGFNAQAQTGYDRTAQLTFTFGANRLICGSGGRQPAASKQLVAKR